MVHNAKYEVGKYNKLSKELGLSRHHVPQQAVMKKLDPNYNPRTAPAIKVPNKGHLTKGKKGIVSRDTRNINNVKDLIERDISELRRVFPDIPESVLDQLRNYP